MVTFTPDGRRILVANEGEPSGYLAGDVDPAGSISVVDVQPRNQLQVHTIDFTPFDPGGARAGELPAGVRIFGSSLPSLDLEPEYITIAADGQTAWVSLQEANAIAVLDLNTLTVTRIGAEPEAAAVGVINGRTYGFVSFERIGGFIAVDLADPAAPDIVQYLNNRDFSSAIGPDSGPEVIDFVPAGQSPTGRDLVVVANEITGTVSPHTVVVP